MIIKHHHIGVEFPTEDQFQRSVIQSQVFMIGFGRNVQRKRRRKVFGGKNTSFPIPKGDMIALDLVKNLRGNLLGHPVFGGNQVGERKGGGFTPLYGSKISVFSLSNGWEKPVRLPKIALRC